MREECRECGRLITAQGIAQEKGYCRGCYRRQVDRPRWNLPAARRGSERVLTPNDRYEMEKRQFEGMEQLLWSKDFLAEWEEYLEARMRGEI